MFNCYIILTTVTKAQPVRRHRAAQNVIGGAQAKDVRNPAGRKRGKNRNPKPPPPPGFPASAAMQSRCPPPSDDSGSTEKSRRFLKTDQSKSNRPSSQCGRRSRLEKDGRAVRRKANRCPSPIRAARSRPVASAS